MLTSLFGINRNQQRTGLEIIDLDKMLKKVPTKQLTVETFKRLDEHMRACAQTSETTLKVLKAVAWIVFLIAAEKLNEMFHLVKHMPSLGG